MNSSAIMKLPSGRKLASELSPVTRSALASWSGRVQPSSLRAAVFDLGNVVFNWYPSAASYSLCMREGRGESSAADKVGAVLLDPDLKGPLEKGRIDFQEYYRLASARLGLKKTSERDLARIWNDVFEIREDTISLAQDLERAGLNKYILSDTNEQHFNYLSGLHPFLKNANGYVLSHQTGFYKCDGPQQFETVISFLKTDGLQPSQAIYFDDNPDYTARAISLGLPAMTFLTAADARTMIREVWGLGI